MDTFFYSPGACSLATHIVLEETGYPFEPVVVNLREPAATPRFLETSPGGAVPAMIIEGKAFTEGAALMTYIADKFPKSNLIPPAGTLERIKCQEWLNFCSSRVHTGFTPLFAPQSVLADTNTHDAIKATALEKLKSNFSEIERRLSSSGFAMEKFSVVDGYLMVFFRWAQHFKVDTDVYPKFTRMTQILKERPAVRRAFERERIK